MITLREAFASALAVDRRSALGELRSQRIVAEAKRQALKSHIGLLDLLIREGEVTR
jgi:hypothetical protein